MNDLKGMATVYGLNGTVSYSGVAAPAGWLPQSTDLTHDWEEDIIADPVTNAVKSVAITQEAFNVVIELVVQATDTKAHAKDAIKLPTPWSKVTLAGFDQAASGGVTNGDYNYQKGGKIAYLPKGFVKMTLPLKRYTDSGADATTLSTSAP